MNFAVTNAYHNLGHYNPTSGWFVGGGGAREDPIARNYEWVGVNPTGTIVPLDPSTNIVHPDGTRDVCFSLSESVPTVTKACFTPSPGSTESIAFHDNGWIYGFDPTRAPGTQWRCTGAVPDDVKPIDWVCTVPDYGVILIGSYGGYGTNRMRVYRP